MKQFREIGPAVGQTGKAPTDIGDVANMVKLSSEKVQKIVEIEAESEKHLKNVDEHLSKIQTDFIAQLKQLKENTVSKKAFSDLETTAKVM